MSIIDPYIKYTLAKVAFVKRHKKIVYVTFFICLALLISTSLSLVFFNNHIKKIVSDSDSEVDKASGQEQMDYKEMVNELGDEYSISMGIPKLKEKDEASLRSSEEMKDYFLKQVESYKTNFKSNKIKEAPSSILREQNFYSAETFVFVGKKFITFSSEEINSTQFQASPQKKMTYFTYDRELKKLVTLRDIFVTSDAFYKKVSESVYETMLPEFDNVMIQNTGRQLSNEDKEKIKNVLSHKEESFKLFMIDDNEITFSFNPFTFFQTFSIPYSARIPLSSLKEFRK